MADWRKYYDKDKHKAAQVKYDKENVRHVGLKFNKKNDWDILARLDTIASGKMSYIKRLIREDIKRTGFDPGPKPDPSTLPPVEPVATVSMDEMRERHPDQVPPKELTREEAMKLLGL